MIEILLMFDAPWTGKHLVFRIRKRGGKEAEDVLEAAGGSKSTSFLSNFISGQKTADGAHFRFADVRDSPGVQMWLLVWQGRGEILH